VPHQPVCFGVKGAEGRGQHERDLPLAKDVARLVPYSGFQSPVRNHLEAEGISVEIRRLPRIAHEHPNVVNALQCHGIGGHANRLPARESGSRQDVRLGNCLDPSSLYPVTP